MEMTFDIILYLIPGIFLFIFVPSVILVYFEGWTFDESIYFAFVTLTTIGYGDLVAGELVIGSLILQNFRECSRNVIQKGQSKSQDRPHKYI